MAIAFRPSTATDRRRWLAGTLSVLLLGFAAVAGPAVAAETAKVTKSDAELIEAARFGAGDVGYLVVDAESGKVLAERNPDRPFVPASVAKIATMVPALEILGPDHRFATTLHAEGSVTDGVLTGSLVLRGGGDPFLTGDDLRAMAKQLADSGIKRVDGAFLYDASAMVEQAEISAMQPQAADYNCGLSALSLNFNRVRLAWRTDSGSRSATATEFSDKVRVPAGRVSVSFAATNLPGPYVRQAAEGEDRWLLSPALPPKGEEWLPVGNPSRVTAETFRGLAAKAGVELPEPAAGTVPDGAREVARNESVPLGDIARRVLHSSNNLSAELIGLAASQALTPKRLSLKESASALADWWRDRRPDADWSALDFENQSGLSTKSQTTPREIVTMLREAASLSGEADFHDMLPKIGWKGVEAGARVKTGTMSYVRGLAGYIDTVAGHRLAFAIFFNDAKKRAALDAAFDPHVVAIDAQSRRWRNRAVTLERTLTQGWAERF